MMHSDCACCSNISYCAKAKAARRTEPEEREGREPKPKSANLLQPTGSFTIWEGKIQGGVVHGGVVQGGATGASGLF